MDISYNQLRTWVNNQLFNPRLNMQISILNLLFEEIEKTIDVEDIALIYPKNLFVENVLVDLYLFNKTEYLIKFAYDDKRIITTVLYLKDVTFVEGIIDLRDGTRSLSVKFNNGETLELSSVKDTNVNHRRSFSDLILEINKYLTFKKCNKE